MALTTARISNARWRPPGFGGGIKSLIRSHAASVRSVGYGLTFIPRWYRTDAIYRRLFKQPLRHFNDFLTRVHRRRAFLARRFSDEIRRRFSVLLAKRSTTCLSERGASLM